MQLSGIRLVLAAFAFVAGLAADLMAQEKLEVEGPTPSTLRLGETARVQIRVEGRGADPRAPRLPTVDGLTMQLSAPTRSSYTFFDGRTMVERQGVQYTLGLRPQREGEFVIPAFPIWTGSKEQQIGELRLRVVKDLRGEDMAWIDVEVSPKRVYVHEPIRIRVEFGIQPGLRIAQDVYQRTRYLDIEVDAQWLSQFPGGERITLPDPKGDLRAIISNRELFAAEFDGQFRRGNQTWQRFAFDRAFLPTRTGIVELSAPTLRFQVVRDSGRVDVFGRALTNSENLYAYGKPVAVEVLPIPEAGRPQPYYGAVGRFTITAALDRDTVTVGSSVKLQLVVRGQGNLEFLRLPELDALEGLHKLGSAEVQRDADRVVVDYDLTPLSTDVTMVPAIGWNYFDTTPGVEQFVEVETQPIPLHVNPLANGETLAPLSNAVSKAVTPGVDDIFDLPDLTGPQVLLRPRQPWLSWLAVLGPWLLTALAGFAFTALRRRAADVTGRRSRTALRNFRASLSAGAEPIDALAGYLGDRLDIAAAAVIRADLVACLQQAGIENELATEVGRAIERGTAARYGGGEALSAEAVESLVRRLEPVAIRRAAFGGAQLLLLLPLLACGLVSTAPAQQAASGPESAAVAAYRAGDYAAADAAFASAYAKSGDRRLLQARGNCLFRLGDLPRALWAFESARLGVPRDPQLLANIELVQARLEIPPPDAGFVAELAELQRRLSSGERQALLAACMLIGALCLVAGWRRTGLRWIGVLVLIPGLWLAAEECWLGPSRPKLAIAQQKLAITSEPRADQEPVATVRPGVALSVLGSTAGSFVRVRAGGREGYVVTTAIAVVE
ncbi:MAG: BatD family protein [Planctomycetes bacterium]|nr:BatD family protein [Planctomycetota bacterium]